MKIREIVMRELTPSNGMALTNGETCFPPDEPICLGVNDSPDNWREITAEEYNKFYEEAEGDENEGA